MYSLIRNGLIAAAAVLLVGAAAAVYVWHWTGQPLDLSRDVVVEIAPGETFGQVAGRLARQGVVDAPRLYSVYARLTGEATRIQGGEYRIPAQATPREVLDRLTSGRVLLHAVTFVEGWTTARVLETLAEHDSVRKTVTHLSAAELLPALELGDGNAEGWFFPDTYRFPKGTADAEILRQAHGRMRQTLERVWAERDAGLALETPYQALIMASLIEKETGQSPERAKISQVFNARLQAGMRLQTDPTVIYGIGAAFDGNLRREHLRADQPYNTYRRHGLPPTPIALPGLASLEAAVHPAQGDYLYFVARGDGTSKFSTTLEEHLAAVREFQLGGGPERAQ